MRRLVSTSPAAPERCLPWPASPVPWCFRSKRSSEDIVDEQSIDCDLLVVGGGMAGMSAAGWAAERGARVIVVEKAAAAGGSAILSGGVLWTAASREKMTLYGG